MKVYLSGAFDHRDEVAGLSEFMGRAGITVTSNWLHEPPLAYDATEFDMWERRARANDDMADIRRADAFVYITLWPSTTGGRHVELGMALAWDKRVIRIGPADNMFSHLATIESFETIEAFMQAIVAKEIT